MNKSDLYSFVQKITPPLIFNAFTKSSLYPAAKRTAHRFLNKEHDLSWATIESGPLKGKKLFMDPSGAWQKEMIQGTYDDFFFNYADRLDLEGKVVFDIGAHIGFSSLYFAERVGANGKVFTFEPNPWNIERIGRILDGNPDIKNRITVVPEAISDGEGETGFVFTADVELGTSSGSFIENASTLYEKEGYEKNGGFKRMNVATISIDVFADQNAVPDLIKIDIEGGEFLALQGAERIATTHHPIFLIEIHSIFNMYKAMEMLQKWNYGVTLLKTEKDGRCFISASYIRNE